MLVSEEEGGEIDVGAGRCHVMEFVEMKETKARAARAEAAGRGRREGGRRGGGEGGEGGVEGGGGEGTGVQLPISHASPLPPR